MRKLIACAVAALFAVVSAAGVYAQTGGPGAGRGGAAQRRVAGEVTAVDRAAGRVTVRTGAGESINVTADERTELLRVPPGERTLDKAVKIALADIAVGDRVMVFGSRLVVMSREALAQELERQEARGRRIAGSVAALDPRSKEITLQARGPEGPTPVTVVAAGDVRFLRYAPDSLRHDDARPSSFAELKVGDQLRARGERSADGARFTAEEVVSGSLSRAVGVVTAVDAAANELTLKDERTGRALTVRIGQKSTLKRVPPDLAASSSQGGGQGGGQRGGQGGGVAPAASTGNRPAPERGGRSLQQLLERMPAITLADLKKGDVVSAFVSTDGDPARATAITLITGDAAFIRALQRGQGGPDAGAQETNTGLPGDVLGGGTERRDPPPSRSEPPLER